MYVFKTSYLIILSALLFCSCQKNNDLPSRDVIQIKFINATGKNISNAITATKFIGDIKDGAETDYISFEEFGADTGMPDTQFTAGLDGTIMESSCKFYYCGVEKSKLPPGKYTINIRTITLTEGEFFNLQFKR